ncbi:MAG: hypothetical protein KBD78_14305 [Oligoflexales bacterium]|nr:hypothetical protein [Oligoflexales bacterium]
MFALRIFINLTFLSIVLQSNIAYSQARRFSDYAQLKQALLAELAAAKERIWIASAYMNDGDVASAIYVAKYRKLNVQVLLHPARANSYMSSLRFFKKNNIAVFLQPKSFKTPASSSWLVDKSLITVDGDLDFLAPRRSYNLNKQNGAPASLFEKDFLTALEAKQNAHLTSINSVSRPKGIATPLAAPKTRSTSQQQLPLVRKSASPQVAPLTPAEQRFKSAAHQPFVYSMRGQSRPEHISDKLPSQTISSNSKDAASQLSKGKLIPKKPWGSQNYPLSDQRQSIESY